MNDVLLHIDFDADLLEMKTARKSIESSLLACPRVSGISSNAALCFSEVATNIIQHGQASRIEARLVAQPERVYLEVIDNGKPFGKLPPSTNDIVFDVNQEDGRGLNIVSSLSDTVSYSFNKVLKKNTAFIEWKTPSSSACKCVLLVDDDPAITALYERYLVDEFHVIVSNNVDDALALLTKNKIDVVVSDINMPGQSGVDFRNAINKNEDTAVLPFIFLTMDDSRDVSRRASQLGIDDYLVKPVTKSALVHTIQRVLTQHQRLSKKLNSRIEKNISDALCPELPDHIFGWNIRIAARNTGAGGGDLVLFHQNDDYSYIAVIDVMGHDDAAKFFSYAYAGFIKGAMLSLSDSQMPTILLEMLSEQVHSDPVLEHAFLTCSILKIARTGSIEIVSAGHPNAYMITSDGMRPITQTNMMPGLLPKQTYHATALKTSKGDRLALYTDGLLEGCPSEGMRALLKSDMLMNLERSRNLSLDESLTSCFNLFDEHTNHAPEDDALLILMESDQ